MGENFISRGETAEWKMIYSILVGMDVGQVIDYGMLDAVLGRPFLESRTPIYRARRELFATHQRLLANVSSVGYRIVDPAEHEGVARDHIRRGHRQIVAAKNIVVDTPRKGLAPEARRSLDNLQVHLLTVEEATRALNRRLETGRTPKDEALDEVRQQAQIAENKPEPTNAEVAAKVERLEALMDRFRGADS